MKKKKGLTVSTRQIQNYFDWRGDELKFINQYYGFVYAKVNLKQLIASGEHDGVDDLMKRAEEGNTTPKVILDNKLYLKMEAAAYSIAKERDDYVKVGMNRYLKHPSQGELIRAFLKHGTMITPQLVSEYFEVMEDKIMFVNQKIGFVYTQDVKKIAA